ncbi:MAG: TrkH family potassium uptake protein [Saprospiraceae bacterium]|nr:TrkH family potassium uptake protein [Saprospiraceae bacterium]MCB9310541.1 TrkH family potassium uptake protein [Lewinellaceae bacterium]
MHINFQPISNVLGALMILLGGCMIATSGVSYYYHSTDLNALLLSGGLSAIVGVALWFVRFSRSMEIKKREGYLVVFLGWVFMGLAGALPYYFSGVTPQFVDAVFESISGYTTTGATIFGDIESLPQGILFWRSMTHWIGGMGIIVLTVALFPLLGIGGIELFVAEAPGPTADKIHPRIKETAKRLWFMYFMLTVILSVILYFEGMTVFDSVNHAFATMATGGFSTKNLSIAHFNSPAIEYTISLFMFIAGCNYAMVYYLYKRKYKRVWQDDEFRYYTLFILITAVILGFWININVDGEIEKNFRSGLFMLISLVTTTGFVVDDYTKWSPGLNLFFFLMLFVGGCAGSTSGSIKFIRHTVFVKNTWLEFKRILHPRAMIRLKLNGNIVAPRILTHILVFLLVYLMIFLMGIMVITFIGLDFETALGGVATSLGNVGPSIGKLSPVDNFAWVPTNAKWVFTVLMLMGRLELFTVIIIFTPFFWRSN